MEHQYQRNLWFSLSGCLGWILCMLWINFVGNNHLMVSFLACAFVFIERAREPRKIAGRLKNIELLLASIFGVGLYYSLSNLIEIDTLVFSIFTNKAVAISSTILLLLIPYKLIMNEKLRTVANT